MIHQLFKFLATFIEGYPLCRHRDRSIGFGITADLRPTFSELPSALAVMAHNTGTIFLDLDPDSGFENDYVWCDDHLRDLRDQWTRAKRFLDGLTRFTRALTQRPRLWIDVLTVWNRCCAPAKERTSR